MRLPVSIYAGYLVLAIFTATVQAQHAIILVRHADKETDQTIVKDLPDQQIPLSDVGKARAKTLAGLLKDSGVGAIYTSDALRTQQTAMPLAETLGIPSKELDMTSKAFAHLKEHLRERHQKQVILIVGHSNTVPQMIHQLLNPSGEINIEIADHQFDLMFILVPKPDGSWGLIRSRYGAQTSSSGK